MVSAEVETIICAIFQNADSTENGTMALTHQPNSQEIADVLMVLTIEIVAVLSPTTDVADEKLEAIASALLTTSLGMVQGSRRDLVAAMAKNLIQTEDGAQIGGDGE